jgi:cell division protein FtsB
MASNAVNKVELSKNELIQVQMGAKEDLIKLIAQAGKLVGPARKLEDATSKFADQISTLKKQVPDYIAKNKDMAAQLASLDSQIKSGYDKFQAQLKALGVPKDAVADLEAAIKTLDGNDFYPLQRDLTFNTTYLDKLK